ncbi:MAG TPA: c-type cytochrome [Pirellulales bacterium]|nr:c-type cytochrome [Pirellulales bacterium]
MYVGIGGALVALAAVILSGRAPVASWCRRAAAAHLEAGAISAAEQSLDWAAWAGGDDARTALMRATCLRRLGEIDRWRGALEAAEQAGASAAAVGLERRLGNIRWGQVESVEWSDYNALLEAGAAPREAAHSVVHGLLAKGAHDTARKLADTWAAKSPSPGDAAFLRGVCAWFVGDLDAAVAEFEKTLDHSPRHELAHAAVARLLEDQHRYSQALEHDLWLVAAAPERESARLALARVLRKSGRIEEARALLGRVPPDAHVSQDMALAMAELEFESGNFEVAERWFNRTDLQHRPAPETLRAAAANAALNGDFERAQQLFARVDDPHGAARRRDELVRRIAIDPSDAVAVRELEQLSLLANDSPRPANDASPGTAAALFQQHCAACHGNRGDGTGRAARHLHPRPRNLQAEPYRLISTVSHAPTKADVARVIRDGIPGTSMPSFAKLSAHEQGLLADEVLRLFRERFASAPTPEVAAEESLSVPSIGSPDSAVLARGKELYFQSGCHQCHGNDGTAATTNMLFDSAGRPTAPRNLVWGPLKSGSRPEALFLRIRLGMPGTPHPASPALSDADIVALVHYCRSLGREPKQQLTNAQRGEKAARRAMGPPVEPRSVPPMNPKAEAE